MRFVQSPEVTFEVVDGRAVMVDPAGAELVTLNPTASVVWESFARPCTADDAAAALHERVADAVALDEVRRDVVDLVDELHGLGLLVEA